jgi:hypothetical protein
MLPETRDTQLPIWIPSLVHLINKANSPNIEIVKEKEKAVMNAEPPAPLSLSEGIKTKHEKGKFTPLAFLNRDKSTDRAASLSGSTTSLNTKSAPKKSFFAKTKGNPQ